MSSQSSHHPQEVLLAQLSLYVHKGGLKPDSFHFCLTRFRSVHRSICHWQCCVLTLVTTYNLWEVRDNKLRADMTLGWTCSYHTNELMVATTVSFLILMPFVTALFSLLLTSADELRNCTREYITLHTKLHICWSSLNKLIHFMWSWVYNFTF